MADQDGDKRLNKEEYADFLHPGKSICHSSWVLELNLLTVFSPAPSPSPAEVDHMKSIYIDERMEEMDKDKDGKVSLDEYISMSQQLVIV